MKRALIISYYWPPSGGAGVQRWLKFVKYFHDFCWEPVLFIPKNPEYPEIDKSLEKDVPSRLELIRHPIWEPYGFYKKLIGRRKEEKINAAFLSEKKKNRFVENISIWIRGNLFIPDARKFWITSSVKRLSNYLNDHPVDIIISTGPPHSMHLIAMPLAERFSIPWVADFRDPWTDIDYYKDLKLSSWADKKHHALEKQVLEKANSVVVISKTMAEVFRKIHDRKYEVITNGFDPEDIVEQSLPVDKKFSIAHIGTLVSTRNPISFWEALKSLIAERDDFAKDLEIKLVGKIDFSISSAIESYNLTKYLNKIDYQSHDEVVKCQRQSQVLLLIINNTPNSKMILTGKFFEYLAAKRPILCLGPEDGDASEILKETCSGLISGFDDFNGMKKNILSFYDRYKHGNLESESIDIDRFSRKELARQLTDILNRIIFKESL